jgi:hypothetical protein
MHSFNVLIVLAIAIIFLDGVCNAQDGSLAWREFNLAFGEKKMTSSGMNFPFRVDQCNDQRSK